MKPFDEINMRRHWESEATDYTLGRRHSAVDERILELLNPQTGDRLLEIGFGSFITGAEILRSFPDLEYYGLDFADKFLDIARQTATSTAHLIKASASRLPLRHSSVNFVLEMDAIHHFPLRILPAVVKELAGVLKPGGQFISAEDWAAEPEDERAELAHSIQARRHLVSSGLEYHPTEAEWISMFEDAGLKVVHREHIDRPLNLGRFEELKDEYSQVELSRLRKLWADQHPTTQMTIFICEKI